MRELSLNEVEQVSGGSWFIDLGGLASVFVSAINPNAGLLGAAGVGGYALGGDIYSNLSTQNQNAIGYTVYQMVNNPIGSVGNAFNYWL